MSLATEAVLVPVDNLVPLEGNPRLGDVDAIVSSYQKFGQLKPIVVNTRNHKKKGGHPAGEVIAGNHQLEAAKRLGWTEIACVLVNLDDVTAKAFALADNRTGQLGTYDPDLLLNMLQDVAAFDLEGTGYSEADLDDLIRRLSPPDLESLAASVGDVEEAKDEFHIKLVVTRATMGRWRDYWSNSQLADTDKVNFLLDLVTEA